MAYNTPTGRTLIEKIPTIKRIINSFSAQDTVEPQRAYMYEVYFLSGQTEFNRNIIDFFTSNNVKLYAKNIEIPATSNSTDVIHYLGKKFHYSGKDSTDHTLTLTFWDDEALTVYTFFKKWTEMCSMEYSGKGVSKTSYKNDMMIKLKDVSDTTITKAVKLTSVYPSELGRVNLSYDASEAIEISVILTYDDMEMKH